VFLDEIGEMPAAMQAKLLRVLQESEVVPVGDRRPRRIDVRVISATNRISPPTWRAAPSARTYSTVGRLPDRLPPLRERREDVPLLADRFLAEAAERHGKAIPGLAPAALDLLVSFAWPGNVRELQNEIERAVALAAAGEAIGPQHLSAKLGPSRRRRERLRQSPDPSWSRCARRGPRSRRATSRPSCAGTPAT